LSQAPPVDAIEKPWGIIINYGENGKPVSIEFLNASVRKLAEKGEINVSFPASSGVKNSFIIYLFSLRSLRALREVFSRDARKKENHRFTQIISRITQIKLEENQCLGLCSSVVKNTRDYFMRG